VHNSSTVIQKKYNIRPLFYSGKIMLCSSTVTSKKCTYSIIRRIFAWDDLLLLHHPLPLLAGEILPLPFLATPKTKALRHPSPISPALPRYLINPNIVLYLQYFNQRFRNKSTPPFAAYQRRGGVLDVYSKGIPYS
jgi:hypothetical protein